MEIGVVSQGRQGNLENINNNINNDIKNSEIQVNKEVDVELSDNENKYTEKEVKETVEKLNEALKDKDVYVEYSTHEKFKNTIMMKIIDSDTKKVIVEVPPEKILDTVASMCEFAGVIFDKKV